MKRNQGFTLIELIIVIVILGILAVTAAPRFLNLSGDATAGTLNAVKASLQSAGSIVYGKAVIAGVQNNATGSVVEKGTTTIATVYGYPAATTANMAILLDIDTTADFTVVSATADQFFGAVANDIVIHPFGRTIADDAETSGCHLVYKPSTGVNTKPSIKVYPQGC